MARQVNVKALVALLASMTARGPVPEGNAPSASVPLNFGARAYMSRNQRQRRKLARQTGRYT